MIYICKIPDGCIAGKHIKEMKERSNYKFAENMRFESIDNTLDDNDAVFGRRDRN
jgi:hypothetical protein